MTPALTAPAKHCRPGPGVPVAVLEMPTLEVPADEYCTWIVIACDKRGGSVSRLKYASRMCPNLLSHQAAMRGET